MDFAELWFVFEYAVLVQFEGAELPGVEGAALELCDVSVFAGCVVPECFEYGADDVLFVVWVVVEVVEHAAKHPVPAFEWCVVECVDVSVAVYACVEFVAGESPVVDQVFSGVANVFGDICELLVAETVVEFCFDLVSDFVEVEGVEWDAGDGGFCADLVEGGVLDFAVVVCVADDGVHVEFVVVVDVSGVGDVVVCGVVDVDGVVGSVVWDGDCKVTHVVSIVTPLVRLNPSNKHQTNTNTHTIKTTRQSHDKRQPYVRLILPGRDIMRLITSSSSVPRLEYKNGSAVSSLGTGCLFDIW